MKKFIVFAVVLALLVPALAMAATEFSLGGFIKLDAMWDSQSGVGKNINAPPVRSNDPNGNHGRLKFTAQGSRFNFTIKGPDLWGAKTSGFIEMDFDAAENGLTSGVATGTQGVAFGGASKGYTPRLRHAMFRFNWPTSELLFGQYWSMFCEYFAESAEDGNLQMVGTPTARLAQVRFTQTFGGFTVAGLIGDPNQANLQGIGNAAAVAGAVSTNAGIGVNGPYNAAINNGQSAESPQIQGKISYAQDIWGKAAFYGTPSPFKIQLTGGWQRNVMRTGSFPAQAFGETNLTAAANISVRNTYVNPWLAMGSLFIPVIPTQSANLAGTASILTQWWIGQGVEAFGFTGIASNLYRFNNTFNPGLIGPNYDVQLLEKFGGFVEGQYYFTNQWFLNALYGVSKTMNVSRSQAIFGGRGNNGIGNMEMAFGDNASTIQQAEFTLWYRPIQSIKFGLQYAYTAASYLQANTVPLATANTSRFGADSRVEFVGFFYF